MSLFYSISYKDGSGIKELKIGMASTYASKCNEIKIDNGNQKELEELINSYE